MRPKSSKSEDKDAARLALDVLMMTMENQRYRQKQLLLYSWLQQCGHAYLKVGWDPMAGGPMPNPETGEPGWEGDVTLEILSAFEGFPDPLAQTSEEMRWFIQAKVRKLEYFRSKWPEKGYEVKEEDAWLLSAQYEARINSLNKQGPTSSGISQQVLRNAAIELVYYEKPSLKRPMGRMMTVANGVVLEDKPLPVGKIPVIKFDDVLVGGKFYSESLITHARPMQDQLNRTIRRRAEWTNKLLSGKILAAKGSGLIREALNDQSGEIVYFKPVPNAPPPQTISMPNIPQYAYREQEELERMIDDEFGINEVTKGQLPSASIPAIGMQLLTEQDDTRIGIVTEMLEQSWAEVAQLVIQYVEKFYQMPRLLKVIGKNREWEIKSFKGADLLGNSDVIAIRGSTLPGSKALKRQEILNAYERGLLGDPADPAVREKVLQMLEYGDVGEMWQDQALDMAQIKRDLQMIEAGTYPPVDPNDNHVLHFQEKNRYRKTDKFRLLPDEQKAMLQRNLEEHLNALTNMTAPGSEEDLQTAEQAMAKEIAQIQAGQEAPATMEPGMEFMEPMGGLEMEPSIDTGELVP